MRWNTICKSKEDGGLGIRPLRHVNNALLGKWLWRLGKEDPNLWRQVIVAKYRVMRDGWIVNGAPRGGSSLWKGIASVYDLFTVQVRYRVGLGDKILFWQDLWVGDNTLADQFLHLLYYAKDCLAKVGDYMELNEGQVGWCPVFRRNVTELEEEQLMELLHSLSNLQIIEGVPDRRVWTLAKDGRFSVSSFFYSFLQSTGSSNLWTSLWKIKAPPRVSAFAWLGLHGSVLTMDNLRKRKVIVINAYPLCLADEKIVDHLLVNCRVAWEVWPLSLGLSTIDGSLLAH